MWIFKALADRLKALFIADTACEFEAQFVVRDAERRAALLRQAQRYEDEGLKGVGQEMRLQAESLGTQRPMASVLPAIEFLHTTEAGLFLEDDKAAVALLPAPAPAVPPSPAAAPIPTNRRHSARRKDGDA
jgi:hypothetical protein